MGDLQVLKCFICGLNECRSVRCIHKRRTTIFQERLKNVPKCKIVELTGLPCGMPPALDVIDDNLVLLQDGYCGEKHQQLYETGEWKRTLYKQYENSRKRLENDLRGINKKIETLVMDHVLIKKEKEKEKQK